MWPNHDVPPSSYPIFVVSRPSPKSRIDLNLIQHELKKGVYRYCDTSGLGHVGIVTHREGDTMGWGHNGMGTHLPAPHVFFSRGVLEHPTSFVTKCYHVIVDVCTNL